MWFQLAESIMIDEYRERIDEFIGACHRVGEYGLLRYSSGNMSCRLDEEFVAVTARRAWLGDLELTGGLVRACQRSGPLRFENSADGVGRDWRN